VSVDRDARFWDFVAGRFERTEKRFAPLRAWAIENITKHVDADDRLLDFGCGPGTLTIEIAGSAKEILGIDISAKMIELAKLAAATRATKNVSFAKATIFDQALETESFDAVLACNVLHALEDPQRTVARIRELLKPGGLLIAQTPCLGETMSFRNAASFQVFRLLGALGAIPRVRRFRSGDIDELITSSRLRIVDSDRMFHEMPSYFVVARKS
jgi:2-polyprenyl-3-methyl-5-hydroxy-6-metoxy-1,4-benzoquinol methylase